MFANILGLDAAGGRMYVSSSIWVG